MTVSLDIFANSILETSDNEEDFKYISKRISGMKEYKVYFILVGILCWLFSIATVVLVAYFYKKIKIVSAQLKVKMIRIIIIQTMGLTSFSVLVVVTS